jgi:hypothetical protein
MTSVGRHHFGMGWRWDWDLEAVRRRCFVYYLEEVRTGRRTLATVTMRKSQGWPAGLPGRPNGGVTTRQSHVRNALPGDTNVISRDPFGQG